MDKSNDMSREEWIDRYLKNNLNPEELQQFRAKIQQDTALQQEVEDTQIAQALLQHQGLKNEIKAVRAAMKAEESQPELAEKGAGTFSTQQKPSKVEAEENVKAVPMYQWMGRVAAGLAIVLVGYLTIQYATLSPERLYEEKIASEPPYLGLSNRSMEDREDTIADQVRVEYQFGNYEEVLRLYGELETPTFAETFRAGYAYLEQERTGEAIAAFQRVMQDQNAFMIKDKAEYYLALAYLQDGQIETAVGMLEGIRKNDDHDYEDSLSSLYLWRLRLLKMKY
ncbi:tetratricopeptide repeat protein [Tunicatimonas pelagia]|uniref:tetratricopeptide repeat protein n=1 Tax=Tunicatimonas pelagia TaxID=931531 RepID=UPI00266515EB|nr:tetratricopeptide repeat protein [Tunicatimonas pelagia]WKN41600.1 tetratricopeptide repeat protein [Tunicatimonas pelagia]